jgi:hypothetical protein
MIIYNVTINIDDEVHDEWVKWMQDEHRPDVMKTGYFKEFRFTRVLADDPQGKTYSVQYLCDNFTDYDNYQKKEAPRLQAEHNKRFEGKYVAFRTVLKMIKHG